MRLPSSVTNQFENICQPRPACRCTHRFQSPKKKHSFALICIVRFCRYQPLSSNGLRLFYAVEPLDHESGAVGHIYVPRYLRILCFWALYLTHNLYVGLHIQTVILKYWALNVDHYSSLSPIIWAIYADHFYYRILWQKKHAA